MPTKAIDDKAPYWPLCLCAHSHHTIVTHAHVRMRAHTHTHTHTHTALMQGKGTSLESSSGFWNPWLCGFPGPQFPPV